MNDCSNAEMRDQLPDLLHERLTAEARALVVEHLSSCVDCTEELELLRGVLAMLDARTPRVNIATIVSALPAPPRAAPVHSAPNVIPLASKQRRWADWRVAAAVTLLVAGGSSAVLLNHEAAPPVAPVATATASVSTGESAAPATGAIARTDASTDSAIPASSDAATRRPTANTVADAGAASDGEADASVGGAALSNLSEQQLQTLLNEIKQLPAVPVTEPDPVSLRVTAGSSASEGA